MRRTVHDSPFGSGVCRAGCSKLAALYQQVASQGCVSQPISSFAQQIPARDDAWELSEAQLSGRQETQQFAKQIAVKRCKQLPVTADTSQQFCWCATKVHHAAVGATVPVASESGQAARQCSNQKQWEDQAGLLQECSFKSLNLKYYELGADKVTAYWAKI